MNIKYQCFFFGCLFHIGINMFLQDVLSLEGYINYVRAGWVDMSPWWGIGVITISLIAFANTKYNH